MRTKLGDIYPPPIYMHIFFYKESQGGIIYLYPYRRGKRGRKADNIYSFRSSAP